MLLLNDLDDDKDTIAESKTVISANSPKVMYCDISFIH